MRRPSLRLLPHDPGTAWTPYAWLVYLPCQFIPLMAGGGTRFEWTVTIAGIVAFLPIYFRSYWVCGNAVIPYALAMAVIGALVAPVNPFASTYFVYAASYVPEVAKRPAAWRILGAFLLSVGAYAWLVHLNAYAWGTGIVFSALIGAIRIQQVERSALDTDLRLAHDEVERLAKVAERERIARDMHDVLGHTLSVIVLKSELASRLAARDIDRAAREIADVERIARESLTELREAIAGYRASGIVAEVRRARGVLGAAGVSVDWELGEIDLSPRHEGVLALAIREAVTNIVRHAGASTCRLQIAQTSRECRFEISDDGRGGSSGEGFGLLGMRERVESLGGTLVRDVSHGTRLTLTLPVAGRA